MIAACREIERTVGNARGNCVTLVAAGLLAALATAAVSAEEAPSTTSVVAVRVDIGGARAFETFLAQFRDAMASRQDAPAWSVSTNAVGIISDFYIVWTAPGLSGLGRAEDPLEPMLAALDEQVAAATAESLERTVTAASARSWIARPELGRSVAADAQPVGFTVMYIDVKAGAADAFEGYMKALVEASDKLDDGSWTAMSGAPGGRSDYLITIPIYKWSELDDPAVRTTRERMITAFGEREGAKRYAQGVSAIEDITTSLIRARPDLSHTVGD